MPVIAINVMLKSLNVLEKHDKVFTGKIFEWLKFAFSMCDREGRWSNIGKMLTPGAHGTLLSTFDYVSKFP